MTSSCRGRSIEGSATELFLLLHRVTYDRTRTAAVHFNSNTHELIRQFYFGRPTVVGLIIGCAVEITPATVRATVAVLSRLGIAAECRHDMRLSVQLSGVSGVDSKLGLKLWLHVK